MTYLRGEYSYIRYARSIRGRRRRRRRRRRILNVG